MRARFYNPYLCRFISADPSGFGGGLNHYAFASGNPVSLLDPFGLNATATGDTSFGWVQAPDELAPCIMCHGVSAGGFNGDVNSFSSYLPGSGPNAALGYAVEHHLAIMATPLVAGPMGEFFAASLDAGMGGALLAGGATTTVLGESDKVIGFVQNGKVIGQSTLGDDFATAMSHERFATQLGVYEGPGALSGGTEAFTVVKQSGKILIRGSNNFEPTLSPQTQAYLQSLFK